MTTTTALIVNALLALTIAGGLAAVVRLALRLRNAEHAEKTPRLSQPLPLRLVAPEDEERDLVRAA
jgi:hypothetical protein